MLKKQPLTIVKEGWLFKQSKHLKQWRKYFKQKEIRRWVVLTPTHVYTFKEYKVYDKPTEEIEISSCKTVKGVEDEINLKFSFVSIKKCKVVYNNKGESVLFSGRELYG